MNTAELIEGCACTRIRTAARLVTRTYDDALRPVGLKASQLSVLAAAHETESASIAALSKVLSMDRTTLSRNLKPLFDAGLIEMREEGPGRGKTVTVTRAGEKALRAAMPRWHEAQAALAKRFGDKRLRELGRQLQELIDSH